MENICCGAPLNESDRSVLEFRSVSNGEMASKTEENPYAKRKYKGGGLIEWNKFSANIDWDVEFHNRITEESYERFCEI